MKTTTATAITVPINKQALRYFLVSTSKDIQETNRERFVVIVAIYF